VDARADERHREGAFRLALIPPIARAPLLVLGFVGLVVGVGGGLARLGFGVPDVAAMSAALHGPLMVCGFFGVVIGLERAVAVGYPWSYAGPLATGLGTIAALAGAMSVGQWLVVGGSVVLLAATIDIFRRQRALFTFTLALGALCWTVGSARWALGTDVHAVVLWWLAFLVLTIAGERLELSRFLPPSRIAKAAFAAILAVIVAGLVAAATAWGPPLHAAALVALALWLLRQDIARRTVRNRGLTRFIAVCLLSGYAWLAVGGAIIVGAGGLAPGSPSYDAALHALALGFVFAMVFGHAPIIFPAVLRVAVPYHPTFYAPLVLLHVSLAARMIGDATAGFAWTRVGGLGNAIALAAFIVGTASAVFRGRRRGLAASEGGAPS
jgi:hypothetical protein